MTNYIQLVNKFGITVLKISDQAV